MEINFLVILLSALIPLFIGFIWYHPKVLGTAWMNASGLTEENMKGANMLMIFVLSYVFAFLLAMSLQFMVIHQYHVYSILVNEPGVNDSTSETGQYLASFLEKYGQNFRTFKHGAFHGALAGFFIALPIIGTSALFERKGFKYIAVNVGYWVVTLALMGGVICQFA